MKAEIYQDKAGGWRWRLTAKNGRIVADSGEAYATRSNLVRALRMLSAFAVHAAFADAVKRAKK